MRNNLLVIGLIALALIGRLIPHPDNFTPVLAVALFAGALLPMRLAYVVPLIAVLLSDLIIGGPLDASNLAVYGALALTAGAGQVLGRRRTWGRTGGVAVASSLLFFIVTNFAVWAMPEGLYPHTLAGFIDCYVLAIPFFRNELLGTLFWSFLLFGIYDLGRARLETLRPQQAVR